MRKDYPITQGQLCHRTDDLMDEMTPRLKKRGLDKEEGLMFLNLGPAHPASHGTICTFVALDGESILCAVSEIGYLHRGFENRVKTILTIKLFLIPTASITALRF